MSFGDRLKHARKFVGMTQKELAEKLNVTPSMIAQYETGKRNPKKETLEKIASALDLSCGFTRAGTPYFYTFVDPAADENDKNKQFNEWQSTDAMKENIEPIGTRIKKLRKKRAISREDFANYIGIDRKSLEKYESNFQIPDNEILERIASALGMLSCELKGITPQQELQNWLSDSKKETTLLDHLLALGYEYVPTFYDNYDGYDRCLHIVSENIDIPLTEKEYEKLVNNIENDIETEIYKLRREKNL